jgi:hypothetical protein
MGLAFENLPAGYEHRRCVPLVRRNKKYVLRESSLIKHNDYKYAPELKQKGVKLLDYTELFALN